MTTLVGEHCAACRSDSPRVTEAELPELKAQVPDWELIEVEGIPRLRREFRFKNFAQALAFANRVGAIAEEQDHHPAILVEYGKVTVSWWTHAVHGLHRNDFIMAARTSQLLQE